MVIVGSPVPLRVTARDASGRELPPGAATFVSRDPGVVAVDGAGVVTGVSPGASYVVGSIASGGRILADSVEIHVECTMELRVHTSPRDTTIAVGESFVPRVEMSGCGGHVRLSDTLTWRARDPRVLHVDPATGRARGRAPGETWVEVTGRKYGTFEATRVTVRRP